MASAMAHPKGNPEKWTRKSSNNNPCTRSRPRTRADFGSSIASLLGFCAVVDHVNRRNIMRHISHFSCYFLRPGEREELSDHDDDGLFSTLCVYKTHKSPVSAFSRPSDPRPWHLGWRLFRTRILIEICSVVDNTTLLR
jgi:hypothetical protein